MGGTSTDISLVYEGEPKVTKEWSVEYGYPIRFPSIEVLTIGAGGGSLAWIDEAGSLRNGPQSAGADPGPASYGRGGEEPTNTDANLLLGRLGTELIGGGMELDRDAAEAAIRDKVAEPLGLDAMDAAGAVIEVANANMADAVRLISIRKGYDPREFALVVFGGAGPLHGAALAKELMIPTVIVPPNPGVTSALGCLLVDVRHDLSEMYSGKADEVDAAEVEEAFARLEKEAREMLDAEGIPEDRVRLTREIDMRYVGQWRALPIEVEAPLESLDPVVEAFHAEHEREHSYRREDSPVEVYQLNVRAVGETEKAELPSHDADGGEPEPTGTREVVFDRGEDAVEAPVFARDDLPAGASFEGPALIDQLDSTVLVPPGVKVEVDEWLNIRMQIEQEDES